MLRRKLILVLGSLVGVMALVAIVAIWQLQEVLADLDHISTTDAVTLRKVDGLSQTVTEIELALREIELRRERHLDTLIDRVEALQRGAGQFGAELQGPLPQGLPLYRHLVGVLPVFERNIEALATTEDAALAQTHTAEALAASVSMRRDIVELSKMMHEHVMQEEAQATAWLRRLVLGLGIVFLLLINVAVLALLRVAMMILRPVEQLVEGSRQLARENFGYRVQVRQADEFGELARSFNQLAAELQANEARRLEMLGQVAVTLSHELNNAGAIIKLQLRILERQGGGGVAFAECLRQINESVGRMTQTVEALKKVRRIVLTDYTSGTKMLDLARSVE